MPRIQMSLAVKLFAAATSADGSPADLPGILAGLSDSTLDEAERLTTLFAERGESHRLIQRSAGRRVTITPEHHKMVRDAIRDEETARCGL